jgi:hypothetical protein
MRGSADQNTRGSTSSFQPQFIELCKKYISEKLNFSFTSKSRSKLPIKAFLSDDSSLFKTLDTKSITEAIKIINADISITEKSKSGFRDIIYFCPFDEFSNPLIKRKFRHSIDNSKIQYDIISYSEILKTLNQDEGNLDHNLLLSANLNQLYSNTYPPSAKSITVLDDIFDYVKKNFNQKIPDSKKEKSLTRLTQKIADNFGIPERPRIVAFYTSRWRYKEVVEKYIISNFNAANFSFYPLLNTIQNKFRELNKFNEVETPVNYIGVLIELANTLIPVGRKHLNEYNTLAEAIVLYFFEYCDFGQRFENEELSLFQKQSDNS